MKMAKRRKRQSAPQAELENLHAELARVLKENLATKGEDGKINSALLNVARQFLKDNDITSPVVAPDSDLGVLSRLPVFDDDEVTGAGHAH